MAEQASFDSVELNLLCSSGLTKTFAFVTTRHSPEVNFTLHSLFQKVPIYLYLSIYDLTIYYLRFIFDLTI